MTAKPRSADHQSFTIERDYAASLAEVFAAFADPAAKRAWFVEGEGFSTDEYRLDFRIGGEEVWRGTAPNDAAITNHTVYHDIVENSRIVTSYRMAVAGTPISVSLATTALAPHGSGTRLTYTEQAVFLDGEDNAQSREKGCRWLFDQLAARLDGSSAAA